MRRVGRGGRGSGLPSVWAALASGVGFWGVAASLGPPTSSPLMGRAERVPTGHTQRAVSG